MEVSINGTVRSTRASPIRSNMPCTRLASIEDELIVRQTHPAMFIFYVKVNSNTRPTVRRKFNDHYCGQTTCRIQAGH